LSAKEKPGIHPASSAGQAFSGSCSGSEQDDFVMNSEQVVSIADAKTENKVDFEHLGIIDPMPEKPIVSTAWSVLEAANDLDDVPTVDACLRVIGADFSGALPARSDINIVFDFFN
jgi:hypothetical protein